MLRIVGTLCSVGCTKTPRLSPTFIMPIQHCPDEVLDMVFQLIPFDSPDKAPATLLSTILTCSRFCAIAKRHLIRVVSLQTAERVELFAAYLVQLTDTGAYGKALLPIEHMAAFGKYRFRQDLFWQDTLEPTTVTGCTLPLIISIAAPSLRSLTIFGFGPHHNRTNVDGRFVKNTVKSSVCFPRLQKLILLEQHIIRLDREEEPNDCSPQRCYPRLTSLYTHMGHVNDDVLALSTLRELRLELLTLPGFPKLPSPPILHAETIILDAPPYQESVMYRGSWFNQTWSMYNEGIESYHAFVEANSTSSESSVVMTPDVCVSPVTVLDAWRDIVAGGSGCWKKG